MDAGKSAKIKECINTLLKNKNLRETAWVTLDKAIKKEWAIVLAWQDGFEKTENPNEYQYDTYRICGKVAYNDTSMRDYDIDWVMPYDEGTGEVDDTECSIERAEDISDAVAFWLNCWGRIKENI